MTENNRSNPVPMKERMKIPRQHMPEQPAEVRAHNFTGSEPGLFRGTGKVGGSALHRMRQDDVRDEMPGRRKDARVR